VFGGRAGMARRAHRAVAPIALRPRLSTGLPLSHGPEVAQRG